MKLFKPIIIDNVEIKNRIVMPGMETNFGDENGFITDKNLKYYELRAKGGIGLIIVEATYFDRVGRGTLNMLGVEKESQVVKLSKLAKIIKENGAKVIVQIYHAGIQATSFLTGEQIVGPSNIPSKLTGVVPKPLTKKMIRKLIANYANACHRIKKAGFDGVEIHAGHGYLLNQFFSPLYNDRKDEYGGSFENRIRLAIEVLKAIREKCGDNFIVGFRLNCRDFIEGGLEINEMVKIAVRLEEEGVGLLNITAGIFDSPYYPVVPFMNQPQGVYSDYAAEIKKAVKKTPVCVVGRITTPEIAEKILLEEKADMVAMGRASIADPFFPMKIQENRREAIKICPSCNACLNQILIEEPLRCAINPNVIGNYEDILPAEKKMKVLILGAGPAGLEAACIASIRGHQVKIIDKADKIGGNLNIASAAPIKKEMKNVILNYQYLINKYGIDIQLNTPYNSDIVKDFQPEVAIIASGSKPNIPEINGLDSIEYSIYHDVLNGKIPSGSNIAILGGGMIGIETANYLADKEKKISLIEENAVLGADLYSLVGSELVQRTYDDKSVEVYTNTIIKEINGEELICKQNENEFKIKFENLVIATEAKPYADFEAELKELVPKVFKIGDCKQRTVRKLLDAVSDGYEIGMTLETATPTPTITDFKGKGGLRDLLVTKVKSGQFGIEDIPDYLKVLVEICNENKKIQSKSKKTKLAFIFKVAPGPSFWIKIQNGKFTTGEGTLEQQDVIIEMNKNIAAGIFTGEVNASAAYMSKQLKFIGPLRHGMKF